MLPSLVLQYASGDECIHRPAASSEPMSGCSTTGRTPSRDRERIRPPTRFRTPRSGRRRILSTGHRKSRRHERGTPARVPHRLLRAGGDDLRDPLIPLTVIVGANVIELVILRSYHRTISPRSPSVPGRAADILEPFCRSRHGHQPASGSDRMARNSSIGASALISDEMTL